MRLIQVLLLVLVSHIGFSQVQTGKASFYADKFEGRPTASGAIYKHNLATAAHRKLALGTKVKVTNLANNKSAVVLINDRGPFIRGRIIDVSQSVAKRLGFINSGVTDVTIEVISGTSTPNEAPTRVASTSPTSTETIVTKHQLISSKSVVENREFYSLEVNRIKPNFFGVQIGSFQEVANLIRLADQLKISYRKAVSVQVKRFDDVMVYSLILGDFKNRLAAERFKSKIDQNYPDAFIVDLSSN